MNLSLPISVNTLLSRVHHTLKKKKNSAWPNTTQKPQSSKPHREPNSEGPHSQQSKTWAVLPPDTIWESGLMCFINKWLLYSWKWSKTQWHSRSLAFVSKRRWGLTGFWAMRALWYMSFWRGCSSLKIYHLRPFFLRMWISTQKIWFDRVRRLCLETLINSPSPRDSRFTWPNCSAADPNKPSNKMKVQQISSI